MSMTAVPAAMFVSAQRPRVAKGSKNGKKGARSKSRLVKDGQVVAKIYDVLGVRPYPTITSLEQGITVTLVGNAALFTTSATVPVYGGTFYTLNQFGDYTQYSTLFDQYLIHQIEVWIEPYNPTMTSSLGSTTMYTAIDLDDANTPAGAADVSERQGSLAGSTVIGRYHKWKPHVAIAEYSGAFTSFGNEPSGWIDVASPAVQHYGLKWATVGADGTARSISQEYRATISFRGPAI